MRLGTTVLPNARIVSDTPVKKTVKHAYAWSNLNRTTHMGSGPREIVIEGYAENVIDRDAVEVACLSDVAVDLLFESMLGLPVEDRRYIVTTSAAVFVCENASVWYYSFTATADDPVAYWDNSYLALLNMALWAADDDLAVL